jgi:hypothetical protein
MHQWPDSGWLIPGGRLTLSADLMRMKSHRVRCRLSRRVAVDCLGKPERQRDYLRGAGDTAKRYCSDISRAPWRSNHFRIGSFEPA